MSDYGMMAGRYPATVKEYLPARRTCRVEIPGLTDGADVFPEAEIEYPIGDKPKAGEKSTEIEILVGDTVWVSFIGGDPRYPIITGWRNPQAGNGVDWRRWHHQNMELIAVAQIIVRAGEDILIKSGTKVTVQCPEAIIDAPETRATGNMTIAGNLDVNGGSVKHGGVNIGKTHTHGGVQTGGGSTGVPK